MSTSNNIRVIVRFRPPNEREKREAVSGATFQLSDSTVTVADGKESMAPFAFDHVFGEHSTQYDIYEKAARDTIVDVLNGFNGTIFAYGFCCSRFLKFKTKKFVAKTNNNIDDKQIKLGQTGSGKSHSMFGPKESADIAQHGVIPRACAHIFNHIDQDQSSTEYTIKCSFLEIYMETVKDLLAPNSGPVSVACLKEKKQERKKFLMMFLFTVTRSRDSAARCLG